MRYPNILKKNDLIGIFAPSAGVGDKIDEFNHALLNLKEEGYKITVTKSVTNNSLRSASAVLRNQELNELVDNEKVKMILCASGGDFMLEMVDLIDYERISKSNKWVAGYSDPTNLLFPLTCGYDIATIYGMNAKSYSDKDETYQNNIEIIKGNLIKQNSFSHYHYYDDYSLSPIPLRNVMWESSKDIFCKGRIIGGCLDVIAKLIGTKVDFVSDFINKYKKDGIIWYFDIFALSAYEVYLTLLQMKNAGYFNYSKCILIGRIAFEKDDNPGINYDEAYKNVFENIPFIKNVDIGHVSPSFTIINGSYATVEYSNGKGSIIQELI